MNIPSSWSTWLIVIWAVLFSYAIITRLLRLIGKPGGLSEPRFEEMVFDESYASVRSHKKISTRLGGGSRCMRISITKKALFVRPHFPFSIIGADADLIHEIPLSAVLDVSEFSKGSVTLIAVRFGDDQRVDIMLKRSNEFLTAISRCLDNAEPA